jgi:hypothetical protein
MLRLFFLEMCHLEAPHCSAFIPSSNVFPSSSKTCSTGTTCVHSRIQHEIWFKKIGRHNTQITTVLLFYGDLWHAQETLSEDTTRKQLQSCYFMVTSGLRKRHYRRYNTQTTTVLLFYGDLWPAQETLSEDTIRKQLQSCYFMVISCQRRRHYREIQHENNYSPAILWWPLAWKRRHYRKIQHANNYSPAILWWPLACVGDIIGDTTRKQLVLLFYGDLWPAQDIIGRYNTQTTTVLLFYGGDVWPAQDK